jgi:gamma-glutamyltranspeptidase/glutathione hydrolase
MTRDPSDRVLAPVRLARGRRGAVVAPHHLASTAGLAVLARGGHAVDAAIATNAVLGVVDAGACGVGGDAFWLIWDAAAGRQLALNGSGRAPSGADPAAHRRRGMTVLPLRGPSSISVPGAVRSWADAHHRFGRLPVADLLAPAIDLAAGGFPAWDGFIEEVEAAAPEIAREMGGDAPFFATFRPHGRPWRPGELVRLPALARTLRTLADDGLDAFYDGPLGERQVGALAAAGAPFGPHDLTSHTSTWTEPIATTYRGVRVTTHPPNSSGIVALEILDVLERFEPPASSAFGPDGVREPRWIHLAIEAAKLAIADRDRWLTDPEARQVPVARLLDEGHAAELARRIDPAVASRPAPVSNPSGGGTVWLGVVDAAGNAVSLIESNYKGFGSGVVDPETGIHYHDRGSYFSLDPEHPNVLAPGKRTLHTLMPGMLFRAGEREPWVVAGSMGGDAQPQVHAQLVSALVDGGLDVADAISIPRWFVGASTHFAPPLDVLVERRFPPGVLDALEAMGHRVVRVGLFDGNLGHEHAIELVAGGPRVEGGSLAAATDPRSAGLPAVH